MTPNKIKLAISPINWSNDDMPELGRHISFEQCLQEIAAAGYQGCEIGHKFPRDPKKLSEVLSAYQLKVASGWLSLYFTEAGREDETLQAFSNHLNFLKALDVKVIVVCECGHSIHGKPVPILGHAPIFSDQEWQYLLKGLQHIGEIARKNDMTIVYHHHMGTGIENQADIDRLMAETKAEEVSLLLDTGHLTFSGGDAISLLQKHYKRIKHVHLKDVRAEILRRVREEYLSFFAAIKGGVFTVPGDGSIDFYPILRLFSDLDYQGWWVIEAEQDPNLAPPLTYAIRAREFLRSIVIKK